MQEIKMAAESPITVKNGIFTITIPMDLERNQFGPAAFKIIGESEMAAENKSILDAVADTANAAFEHAFELHKEGKSGQADDVANFARSMSEHAREIEDHERIMNERHGVNVNLPANATTLTASPRNSSED